MDKVFVYRNLNRRGVVWSVKDVALGKVIDRTPEVFLRDVKLKVSQAGRARVLRLRQRNVHAGAEGLRVGPVVRSGWVRATYDSYRFESFVLATGEPVFQARFAKLTSTGLWVIL